MRLGLFGGTFDPPHNGHLLLAESALTALHLTQVLFIPAKQPPHKLDEQISPLEARVALLECALRDHPEFSISLIEAERAGPSYTVDTLRELHAALPSGTELFFLMGLDSLENLPGWREPAEIVKLCRLAVLSRPGYDVDLDALEAAVPGLKQSVVFILAPELDISASEIRERVQTGKSLQDLVPPAVADYIRDHHLYQGN